MKTLQKISEMFVKTDDVFLQKSANHVPFLRKITILRRII